MYFDFDDKKHIQLYQIDVAFMWTYIEWQELEILTEHIQFHGRLSYAIAHQFVGGATGQRLTVILPRWGYRKYRGACIAILGDLR